MGVTVRPLLSRAPDGSHARRGRLRLVGAETGEWYHAIVYHEDTVGGAYKELIDWLDDHPHVVLDPRTVAEGGEAFLARMRALVAPPHPPHIPTRARKRQGALRSPRKGARDST